MMRGLSAFLNDLEQVLTLSITRVRSQSVKSSAADRGRRRLRTALALSALPVVFMLGCSPERGEDPAPTEPSRAESTPRPARIHEPSPRLIVLVSIDTLRADHLGTYGYDRFTSPRLDAVAAEGVLFEDASATAPWTLPSHASILTGLSVLNHQVMTPATGLAESIPTIASMLGRHGYKTAAVVNTPWLKREDFGLTKDFGLYEFIETTDQRRSPNTLVTDTAIDWIREHTRKADKLFLFVHYFDVHSDYASLPEYEKLFVTPYTGPANGTSWQLQLANLEDEYLDLCTNHFDEKKCSFGGANGPTRVDGSTRRVEFDSADIRHMEELYDAGIRQLDTELGRLITAIQELQSRENTLLVITADHGEEFMEHGRVDHFLTQYQEVLHVPLIVWGGGVPAGRRIAAPVSTLDIVPTILTAAGVRNPPRLDGLDLSSIIRGGGTSSLEERTLYGEASGGLTFDLIVEKGILPVYTMVRRGRYKLVHDTRTNRYRLFDLDTDPGEQHDLADQLPKIAAGLRVTLDRRRAAMAAATSRAPSVHLDPEDSERLRELGYIVP